MQRVVCPRTLENRTSFVDARSQSGGDFDKAYISDMVSDHSKLLDAFSTKVNDATDTQFKATIEQGKSVVAAHKNIALTSIKSCSSSRSGKITDCKAPVTRRRGFLLRAA